MKLVNDTCDICNNELEYIGVCTQESFTNMLMYRCDICGSFYYIERGQDLYNGFSTRDLKRIKIPKIWEKDKEKLENILYCMGERQKREDL